MRQTTISPSLAFFLLPVFHFKLIQIDFPPTSGSYLSFAILPSKVLFLCYLHFLILHPIHSLNNLIYSLLPFLQCNCYCLKDLLFASLVLLFRNFFFFFPIKYYNKAIISTFTFWLTMYCNWEPYIYIHTYTFVILYNVFKFYYKIVISKVDCTDFTCPTRIMLCNTAVITVLY